jgi:hypothetical protein
MPLPSLYRRAAYGACAMNLLMGASFPGGAQRQPSAAASGTAAVTPARFASMDWLAGRWRGRMAGGESFYEEYRFRDDSTLEVRTYADSGFGAVAGTDSYAMQRAAARPTAQGDDRAAVRRAVLDYVEGFYEGDTAKLARSVWPEVRKYGYARSSGGYRGMAMPFPTGFVAYADGVRTGRHKTPPGARKDVTLFDVQDQTASAKLTAWWGTDYLLLAKEGGRWQITHVLWQSAPAGAR